MKETLPIVYFLDAAVSITGAFVSARYAAVALKDSARIVMVLPQGSTIPINELSDFWRVDYIPITGLSKNGRAILRYLPCLLIASLKLRLNMWRDRATRLQINDFYLLHGAVLRLLGYRGHIAVWVRCEPRRFAGFLARPMLELARLGANRVVAVSSFIHRLLPHYFQADIIYNFYKGDARIAAPNPAATEKILVYVGNYIQGKGQDVALSAFLIAAAQDASLHLHFCGSDMGLQKNRDYRQRLEATANASGMGHRIRFDDFLTNTYTLLEHAYAALNFSYSESFSMTVLEASGAGVPVIATASGGPQEIIVEGVTGHIVPVGDVAAAAESMLALARDPGRAAAMGMAGAAHVRTHFSETTFIANVLSVLDL